MSDLHVVALNASHMPAFAALGEAASSSCACRYWHFPGTKNEWLARCAHDPEENLREQASAAARGDPTARGLLALLDGLAVGWMKLAPRAAMPKLRALPVYRALPLEPDAGVHVIGCLLVHPAHRRRAVARTLVQAADAHVLTGGGTAIEAYPRSSPEPLHEEEMWMGPEALYLACGFTAVAGERPYPIYRKELTKAR